MKLYLFETCPYCVKLRAFIGLKDIPIELSFLDLGSIPSKLKEKLDHFSVPILEKDTGEILQESDDIIEYLDNLVQSPLLDHYRISEELNTCFENMKFEMDALIYPRLLWFDIPELASKKSVNLFVASREEYLGNTLKQVLGKTPDYLPAIYKGLDEIEALILPQKLENKYRKFNLNDLWVFAQLRNLMLVEELILPVKLKEFMQLISQETNVRLFGKKDYKGEYYV